jgi:hypothetical protein
VIDTRQMIGSRRRMRFSSSLILVLEAVIAAGMLASCSRDAAPGSPASSSLHVFAREETPMVVLDIFSGRPSPSWSLTAAQAEELVRLLESLPADESKGGADQAPGLGYRGFTIQGRGARIAAFRGRVSVHSDGAERRLSDPERNVERWLLGTGEPSLEPAVRNLVAREIDER